MGGKSGGTEPKGAADEAGSRMAADGAPDRPSRRERIFGRLRELGAEPKRSLGQNFLISDHVVDRILQAVKSESYAELVEVGPGLGALTEDLLSLESPLTLLELDTKFAAYWRGRAAAVPMTAAAGDSAPPPLRVVECDALKVDWTTLELKPGTLFVSNLPYQISSSLVIERSLEPAGVTRMVLMFQKEVAQRIAAKASTKEYGLLTVIAQAFWETATVVDAGPGSFFPPPNVASRVLSFRRRKDPFGSDGVAEQGGASGAVSGSMGSVPNATGFLKFVKAAFSHRRKLLSRNLIGEYFGGKKELLPDLEAVFSSEGLKASARAEELDPRAFIRLYQAVSARF